MTLLCSVRKSWLWYLRCGCDRAGITDHRHTLIPAHSHIRVISRPESVTQWGIKQYFMQEHFTNVRILARVTQSACDKCNLGRDLTSVTMLNGPSCFVKTHVNNISCSQNNLTVTKQFNKQDNYILSRACYLKSAPLSIILCRDGPGPARVACARHVCRHGAATWPARAPAVP